MIPTGIFKDVRCELPATLSSDLAGVVTEVGSRVTRFQVGDAVFAVGIRFAQSHRGVGQVQLRLGDRQSAHSLRFLRDRRAQRRARFTPVPDGIDRASPPSAASRPDRNMTGR
jgi:NADPH:quinone reductase-like Zn-dependent oxidoreductase